MMKEINDSLFSKEVIENDVPVVVDFGHHGVALVEWLDLLWKN